MGCPFSSLFIQPFISRTYYFNLHTLLLICYWGTLLFLFYWGMLSFIIYTQTKRLL